MTTHFQTLGYSDTRIIIGVLLPSSDKNRHCVIGHHLRFIQNIFFFFTFHGFLMFHNKKCPCSGNIWTNWTRMSNENCCIPAILTDPSLIDIYWRRIVCLQLLFPATDYQQGLRCALETICGRIYCPESGLFSFIGNHLS